MVVLGGVFGSAAMGGGWVMEWLLVAVPVVVFLGWALVMGLCAAAGRDVVEDDGEYEERR